MSNMHNNLTTEKTTPLPYNTEAQHPLMFTASNIKSKRAERIPLDSLTFANYMKKKVDFTLYKLQELKPLAKKLKLHITGTKPVIIGRLEKYFRDSIMAIRIQKRFRGFMVLKFVKLKGAGFRNRSLCNNDTDFITMEPLREIPMSLFFSYSDSNSFTYGFNVASIVQSLKNSATLNNPYNREKIEGQTLLDALSVYRVARLLFPELKEEYESYYASSSPNVRPANTRTSRPATTRIARQQQQQQHQYNPTLNPIYIHNNPAEQQRYRTIQEIRNRPIEQRITALFMEMDRLGNYTQRSWFHNLDRTELVRLYRNIYEIWYYRGQISYALRSNICPFHEPFAGVFQGPVSQNNITLEQIRAATLTIIENLVYSGIDEEYRKIGTFHALTGLTIVSLPAREAMPWLYESVI
jgi:hypothetical protein